MADILVVDDERALRRSLELHLQSAGHRVFCAGTAAEALEVWRRERPEAVILDLVLPDGDGLEVMRAAVNESLGGAVVMITGHQDLDKAVAAMRAGAFDYIHKPLNIDELEVVLERALEGLQQRRRLALIADLEAERLPDRIVGQSRAVVELHKQIGLAARGTAPVLILGESGTGKELVARSIHRAVNPGSPFLPVNCSALVATLLESELFGHERGAFTGAVERRPGMLELAADGTLFLDEIGDMEPALQAKLLRVLQEREFRRVGGGQTIPFRARVVAATNKNLAEMAAAGRFREDLYYRLRVVEIRVPALRERKEDLPMLVEFLLARINRQLRRNVTRVPDEVMAAFQAYDWPGNVRELENVLTAAVMRSPGEVLQVEPWQFSGRIHPVTASQPPETAPCWNRTLNEVEAEHIQRVLDAVKGKLGEACKVLGVSRPTLRMKIRRYGLKVS